MFSRRTVEGNRLCQIRESFRRRCLSDDKMALFAGTLGICGCRSQRFRYDGQFILEKLIVSNREASSVSLDGTKLVYLNHRGIRLLDSLKYLTMSLGSVAKTFQIESVKGDFPVKFISEENYDHDGNLLGNEFYSLENKSPHAAFPDITSSQSLELTFF
ncbi:hypothetical protein B9Z55_025770 [Caenorhabditis nigoni]|nr:hypothetical protein B9Z55_025770 [Caenorhabditis nigoni]